MKVIECAHPHHCHNSFLLTYWVWVASGGVQVFLVLEPAWTSTRQGA